MTNRMKTRAIALCMALLMVFGLSALAEEAATGEQASRRAMAQGMVFVDESQLTEEQLAAYNAAKADYEAIEDRELQNLVTYGTITQEELDEYIMMRAEPRQIPQGEGGEPRVFEGGMQMTDEQREALAQAMQSEDSEQAIADLVAQGIITQEAADTMGRIRQGGGQRMGNMGLWGKIQSVMETDTAAQIAVNNIGVAGQMMQQALADAGIEMPTMRRAEAE